MGRSKLTVKQVKEMEKAANRIMTKEQKAQCEQRVVERRKELEVAWRNRVFAVVANPDEALHRAFLEVNQRVQDEVNEYADRLRSDPWHHLRWTSTQFFEMVALQSAVKGYIDFLEREEKEPHEKSKAWRIRSEIARKAREYAGSRHESTSPMSNQMENAAGIAFAKLAGWGYMPLGTKLDLGLPGMTINQLIEAAEAYSRGDAEAALKYNDFAEGC